MFKPKKEFKEVIEERGPLLFYKKAPRILT